MLLWWSVLRRNLLLKLPMGEQSDPKLTCHIGQRLHLSCKPWMMHEATGRRVIPATLFVMSLWPRCCPKTGLAILEGDQLRTYANEWSRLMEPEIG